MSQSAEFIQQAVPKVMGVATAPSSIDPNFGQILQTEVLTLAHIAEFAGAIAIAALALYAINTFRNGRARRRFYAEHPVFSSSEGPTHNAWDVPPGRQDYFPAENPAATYIPGGRTEQPAPMARPTTGATHRPLQSRLNRQQPPASA